MNDALLLCFNARYSLLHLLYAMMRDASVRWAEGRLLLFEWRLRSPLFFPSIILRTWARSYINLLSSSVIRLRLEINCT